MQFFAPKIIKPSVKNSQNDCYFTVGRVLCHAKTKARNNPAFADLKRSEVEKLFFVINKKRI